MHSGEPYLGRSGYNAPKTSFAPISVRTASAKAQRVNPSKHCEHLVAAPIAELLEKGFREARMDRISARAGAPKRTVYKHFDSKENLFHELIRRHWSIFVETLDVTYDPDRDIRDQLLELGHAEGRLLTSPEVMLITRLLMSEVLRSPELVEQTQEKIDFKVAFEIILRDAAGFYKTEQQGLIERGPCPRPAFDERFVIA